MKIDINTCLENSYVITIDNRRHKLFNYRFQHYGLDTPLPRRFDGFQIDNGNYSDCGIVKKGSLCMAYISHAALVRMAKVLDLPFICIFEDDVMPCINARHELEQILSNIPDDADVVRFGHLGDDRNLGVVNVDDYFEIIDSYGSHAYIVFKKYYDKYLEKSKHNFRSDHTVINVRGSNDKIYSTKKMIFAQADFGFGALNANGFYKAVLNKQGYMDNFDIPLYVSPNIIEVDIIHECNWSCPYCSRMCDVIKSNPDSIMTLEEIQHIISEINDVQTMQKVTIIGGEPTMHPQFLEICKLVSNSLRQGIDIEIRTNGYNRQLLNEAIKIPRITYHLDDETKLSKIQKHVNLYDCSMCNETDNFKQCFCMNNSGLNIYKNKRIFYGICCMQNFMTKLLNIENENKICSLKELLSTDWGQIQSRICRHCAMFSYKYYGHDNATKKPGVSQIFENGLQNIKKSHI